MKCSNCGADVDNLTDRCPHCNAMLYPGAEKKYMDELDDMKDDLKQMSKHPFKSILRGCSCVGIITMIVVFLVITILLIHQRKELESERKQEMLDEQVQYEMLMWENEQFPKLDAWYDDKDYESIIAFQESVYAGNGGYNISRWRHYSFIDIYRYYAGILKFEEQIDNKAEIKNYQIGGVLYDAMNLWYECTRENLKNQIPEDEENATWGLTSAELTLIEGYRDTAWKLLTNQLHMSSQEIEDLYQSCRSKGYVGACYDYAESRSWEVEQ